jgi:hypothetical protein
VFVVFAGERGLCAFLADYSELLCLALEEEECNTIGKRVIPGLKTALHSSSPLWSGYDILALLLSSARALDPNNEPRKDIHEADLRVADADGEGSRALLRPVWSCLL